MGLVFPSTLVALLLVTRAPNLFGGSLPHIPRFPVPAYYSRRLSAISMALQAHSVLLHSVVIDVNVRRVMQ
jgi:hypothetical protein